MCGFVGYNGPDAKIVVARANCSQTHRGQSATGQACLERARNNRISVVKVHGRAEKMFINPEWDEMEGEVSIGQTRYPTQGPDSSINIQPHYVDTGEGKIFLSANGDMANMGEVRDFLVNHGQRLYTDNDAEAMAALVKWFMMQQSGRDSKAVVEAIVAMMEKVVGAYSGVLITEWSDDLYVFRCPNGMRPAVLAQFSDNRGTYHMAASETVAIDSALRHLKVHYGHMGPRLDFQREVKPGEVLILNRRELIPNQYSGECQSRICLMDEVYLSRPDSIDLILGKSFSALRRGIGRAFWPHVAEFLKKMKLRADFVCGVPDGGIPFAEDLAAVAKLPYVSAIIRNRDLPPDMEFFRDFINAERGMLQKLIIIEGLVRGKLPLVCDDSIVEGFTSRNLVRGFHALGVRDLVFLSSVPPYRYPCFFGLHTKNPQNFVAARRQTQQLINEWMGCRVLYPTIEQVLATPELQGRKFCTACFTGDYPVKLPRELRSQYGL
jgi:amidophosphoribosyltransferase